MPRFKVTAGASCWSASRLDDARRGALAAFACGELGDCLARQTPPSNLIRVGAGAEPLRGSTNFSGVGPVHAADFCGRVTAMWLRIRRW